MQNKSLHLRLGLIIGLISSYSNMGFSSAQAPFDTDPSSPTFNFKNLPLEMQMELASFFSPGSLRNLRESDKESARNKYLLTLLLHKTPSHDQFINTFPQSPFTEAILPLVTQIKLHQFSEKSASFLRRLPNLKTLDLSASLLLTQDTREADSEKVALLAASLAHFSQLRSLNLRNNALAAEHITLLLPALQTLKLLEVLELSNNGIGNIYMSYSFSNEGIKTLALSFPYLPKLHTLTLQSNGINYKAAQDLAAELHHLKNLHTLKLWFNNIGDSGAQALTDALLTLPSLRIIHFLGANHIQRRLRDSLRKRFALHTKSPPFSICGEKALSFFF